MLKGSFSSSSYWSAVADVLLEQMLILSFVNEAEKQMADSTELTVVHNSNTRCWNTRWCQNYSTKCIKQMFVKKALVWSAESGMKPQLNLLRGYPELSTLSTYEITPHNFLTPSLARRAWLYTFFSEMQKFIVRWHCEICYIFATPSLPFMRLYLISGKCRQVLMTPKLSVIFIILPWQ